MCRYPGITESIKLCYVSQDRKMEGPPSWLPSAMPFFPHLILAYNQAVCALWKLSLDLIWVTFVLLLVHLCACDVYSLSPSRHSTGLVLCCAWCWGMFGLQAPHSYFARTQLSCIWKKDQEGNKGKPQQREFFSLGSKDRVFSEVMQHPLIDVGFFMDRYNLMWFWALKWE